jgi:hypothetical protein
MQLTTNSETISRALSFYINPPRRRITSRIPLDPNRAGAGISSRRLPGTGEPSPSLPPLRAPSVFLGRPHGVASHLVPARLGLSAKRGQQPPRATPAHELTPASSHVAPLCSHTCKSQSRHWHSISFLDASSRSVSHRTAHMPGRCVCSTCSEERNGHLSPRWRACMPARGLESLGATEPASAQ